MYSQKNAYKSLKQHQEDVANIQKLLKKTQVVALKPVEGMHSNMTFEKHYHTNLFPIDISSLNKIISIEDDVVHVEPKVTMEQLATTCLKVGLIPGVLPEFKGITVGGAIMGSALESSSFRLGQFNDQCLEYEVLLGDGSVVVASSQENSDLFYALSSSYGTLGIIVSAKIKLEKASQWVFVEYHSCNSVKDTLAKLTDFANKGTYDYLEAIVYSPNWAILIGAKKTEYFSRIRKNRLSCWKPWFYKYVEKCPSPELMPFQDYLFRHDRGAFWMGAYLSHPKSLWMYLNKVKGKLPLSKKQRKPNALLNRLIPFFLGKFMGSQSLYKVLHQLPDQWFRKNFVVQDFYLPSETAQEFVAYTEEMTQIFPLWICPMKPTKNEQFLSPHYLKNSSILFDIGIYGSPSGQNQDSFYCTRILEKKAEELFGRKMLYADSFYTEEEFWRIYSQEKYEKVRNRYEAKEKLLSLTQKILKE